MILGDESDLLANTAASRIISLTLLERYPSYLEWLLNQLPLFLHFFTLV